MAVGRATALSLCSSRAWLLFAALLSGCASTPAPVASPKVDPTTEAWYAHAAAELAGMAREAETLFAHGRRDEAAAVITKSETVANRLLAVPRPALAAVEAASDLDDLYGRMLMGNGRYGWARLQFQKNVTRWKHWQPRTAEAERRLKAAEDGVAECDRKL